MIDTGTGIPVFSQNKQNSDWGEGLQNKNIQSMHALDIRLDNPAFLHIRPNTGFDFPDIRPDTGTGY
jgi:hypothetical protein